MTPSPAKALKRQGEELDRSTEELKRRRTEKEEDSSRIAELEARVSELETERPAVEPWRIARLRAAEETKALAAALTGLASWDVVEGVHRLAMAYHSDLPLPIYHGDLADAGAAAPPAAAAPAGGAHGIGGTHGKGVGARRKPRKSRAKDPSAPDKRGGARPNTGHHSKTALDSLNQLFLTLVMLRIGVTEELAAVLFGISSSTAARYFTTWVRYLSLMFNKEMPWPTQEEVRRSTPEKWRRVLGGRHVRCIIDGTEIEMEVASEPQAQRATWSEYKVPVACACLCERCTWAQNANTAKFLLGLSPVGAVTFVSRGYPGVSPVDRQRAWQ